MSMMMMRQRKLSVIHKYSGLDGAVVVLVIFVVLISGLVILVSLFSCLRIVYNSRKKRLETIQRNLNTNILLLNVPPVVELASSIEQNHDNTAAEAIVISDVFVPTSTNEIMSRSLQMTRNSFGVLEYFTTGRKDRVARGIPLAEDVRAAAGPSLDRIIPLNHQTQYEQPSTIFGLNNQRYRRAVMSYPPSPFVSAMSRAPY